jgi:hypothetical protein
MAGACQMRRDHSECAITSDGNSSSVIQVRSIQEAPKAL